MVDCEYKQEYTNKKQTETQKTSSGKETAAGVGACKTRIFQHID